jgi:acetyltransferase-like isoleucine patch superfamily enzyme
MRQLLRRLTYLRVPRLMSALRKRWLILRHPHVDIRFDGPVQIGPGFTLFAPEGGALHVGPYVEFRRDFVAELHGGTLTIGGGTVFTYGAVVQCSSRIDIGARCVVAHAVTIVDGNHRFRDPDVPVLAQGYDLRPITIGDDATLLAKATIIADVGARAVVGANAVVTKPVPPFTVAAGAPARVIEELRRPSPA